jgi:hypothetical protein
MELEEAGRAQKWDLVKSGMKSRVMDVGEEEGGEKMGPESMRWLG